MSSRGILTPVTFSTQSPVPFARPTFFTRVLSSGTFATATVISFFCAIVALTLILFVVNIANNRNEGVPVYKTKLMAVGYEKVGKTSLLDCLFPLIATLSTWANPQKDQKTKYIFQLQGKFLRWFGSDRKEALEEIFLNENQWALAINDRTAPLSLRLTRSQTSSTIELLFETQPELLRWADRLKRVIKSDVTHGVDISKYEVDHPATESIRPRKLELSVWDFAGQHD